MSWRNTQIIEMAKAGHTYKEIAGVFGISYARVQQIASPVLGNRQAHMPPATPATPAEVDAIRRLASEGLHAKAIAETIRRGRAVVVTAARNHGIEIANGIDVFGSEMRRRAIAMVIDGMSCSEAADKLGMTKNAVVGACHRAGITIGKRPDVLSRTSGSARAKREREASHA